MTDSYSNYYQSSKMLHGTLTYIMGTQLDALLIGASEQEAIDCWGDIETEIYRLDKLFNKFDEDSKLSAVNRYAVHSPFQIDDELWSVMLDCKQYHYLTKGYFDISLKDFDQVVLDAENHSVFIHNKEIQLDLGGYAKGYALEKIRGILLDKKIYCALINFGNSSVLAIGSHPHGNTWSIGINDPYNPEKILGTIELKDSTMSTSGNMPSHSKHILDPHTGAYQEARRVVSVKSNNAIDAEVLSTTLMIAPDQIVKEIISNFQLDQYLFFDL